MFLFLSSRLRPIVELLFPRSSGSKFQHKEFPPNIFVKIIYFIARVSTMSADFIFYLNSNVFFLIPLSLSLFLLFLSPLSFSSLFFPLFFLSLFSLCLFLSLFINFFLSPPSLSFSSPLSFAYSSIPH